MDNQNTGFQGNMDRTSGPDDNRHAKTGKRRIAIWQICCVLAVLAVAGGVLLTRLPGKAGAQQSINSPKQGASMQWQINGTLNTSVKADVYDIDLFDNTQGTVKTLHSQGRYVICYFSAGTAEDWRSDYKQFQNGNLLGNDDAGWPHEKWVDIRNIKTNSDPTQTALGKIMVARLQQCKNKGFDGVEADNVDEYSPDNNSGFPLTPQDQLNYNRFLATQAHRLGLSIGLKNDSDQAKALQPQFDWALEEECYAQGFCDQVQPFLDAHKAVFDAEYSDGNNAVDESTFLNDYCPQANSAGITAIYTATSLDIASTPCPGTVTTH